MICDNSQSTEDAMSTKLNAGKFDCLSKLSPDEPYFVLRAQDAHAADLVELWAIRARASGCQQDKVLEAQNVADDMRHWPLRKNPD